MSEQIHGAIPSSLQLKKENNMNAVLSPTTAISDRNLAELATKINYVHDHTLRLRGDTIRRARECGKALTAAKQQVLHGDWHKWLAEHCPNLSQRQAQKYVRLHRHSSAIQGGTEGEIQSIDGGLALIAKPRPEAPSEAYLEEDLWDDGSVTLAASSTRIYSIVGCFSGIKEGTDAAQMPLPNLGERLIARVDPHTTIEILRSGDDTFFVTKFCDIDGEAGADYTRKHVFGFGVADQLLSLCSLNAEDIAYLEWRSEPHEPLPGRYHPLHDGEKSWLGPNPNTPLYWVTKLSV